MRNRGITRGGGMSRGGRGQYNPRGHQWRPGHPYQRPPYTPRPHHNACNPHGPQLSPRHFGSHGRGRPGPRHPGARPEGQNGWQHTPRSPPPPGTPVPHRPPPPGTQRLPPPGQFGSPPRGPPPPPRTWLTPSQPPVNASPNQPPGPCANTGNQQQYSSEYPQYNSTACDYMGSDPGRGRGDGDGWGRGRGGGDGWSRGRGRGHGGHFEQSRKKQRKDPTPNKNKSFYCETCDRGYQEYEKYREHCDQHIECPHEGCSYKASPKLIDNHDFQQHKTGLFKLIWNKTSKEDISKWIADRKKNFPSATNIQRKKEELARRVARGEVLQTKDFGKMGRVGVHAKSRAQRVADFHKNKRNKGRQNNDRDTMATTQRRGTNKRGQRSQRARMEKGAKKRGKRALASGVDLKLSKSDVLAYDVSASDEDESEEEKKTKGNMSLVEEINAMAKKMKKEASQPKPQCAGALGSLVSAYGSNDSDSSAEEGEIRDNEPVKSEPLRLPEVERPKVEQAEVHRKRPEVKQGPSSSQKLKPGRRQPGRKPTLLQMLLAPDIRHERNVLLQCVRYVVNKNFFGVGTQRSNSASTQMSKSNNTDKINGDSNKNYVTVTNNNSLEKPPCRTNYDEDEIWDDIKEDFS